MKKVRDGYKMTELGEIPNEWEIIKLNECGYIFGGNAFKSSSFTTEYKENDYQVIRMGNVQLGKLDLEKNPVFLSENLVGEKEKKYLLKEADILISLTGTVNKTDYGNISWVDKNNKYLLNQRVGCLRNDNGEFNNRYYYYLLQSNMFRNQFFECGVGGTGNQANVSIADLNNIKVLKLPTREQEKIASILSTVDEQIDNVDALIEKNKELKKGLMQTLLTKGIGHTRFKKTEIGEIPEEWTLVKIGDVAKFQAGYAFKSSDYVDNGVKLVKITNVQQKDLLWNDTDFLPEEFLNKYKEYSLEINDVIIAMTRPIISSGIKICKVKKEDTPALLNQRVGRFITSENVNNKYLYQYCFSNYFINKVNELCSTTGQPNISSNQLESIMISLPSTEEQEKIGSILLNVDEKMEEYENKKQRLEELKKGLMQQLLTGNIRII